MTSLNSPVSAALPHLPQNQLRFCGLSFAPVDNANNSPVAARNHSRRLLPSAKVMAQLCLLQAFLSCSSRCFHTDRRRHTATLHIGALRTWLLWEHTGHSVPPQVLPEAPYIRLCSHAHRHTDGPSHQHLGLGVAIFGNSAHLWGPTEGMSTCGYLLAGRSPYKGTHMPTPLTRKECRHAADTTLPVQGLRRAQPRVLRWHSPGSGISLGLEKSGVVPWLA